MCVSPLSIPNPNYGRKDKLSYLVDTDSRFIRVPCGYCDECLAVKQMSLVQRVIMESQKNHLFFATLTYNNESIPIKNVNNFQIKYADYKDLNSCIRRIRHYNLFPRVFRYFAVSELGSKRGRPHFHVLFIVPKYSGDDYNTCIGLEQQMFTVLFSNWKRNYGTRKNPVYRPLCTYVRKFVRGRLSTNFDLHYVNPNFQDRGVADVGFYVLKYMLKPSDRARKLQQALRLNLEYGEYIKFWNEVKPRYFKSLDFGLARDKDIQRYLHNGIEQTKDSFDYPVFVNPNNGSTFPLSRFYKSKGDIYDLDQATHFVLNQKNRNDSYVDPSDSELFSHSLRKEFLEKIADSDTDVLQFLYE